MFSVYFNMICYFLQAPWKSCQKESSKNVEATTVDSSMIVFIPIMCEKLGSLWKKNRPHLHAENGIYLCYLCPAIVSTFSLTKCLTPRYLPFSCSKFDVSFAVICLCLLYFCNNQIPQNHGPRLTCSHSCPEKFSQWGK